MKALLIHNLQAGQRDRSNEIAAAVSRLSSAGWRVETAAASTIGEVEQLSRAAVTSLGVDVVVVAGGDGTISAAVQALAHQQAALGVLPTGTGNVWAREMRIPLDVRGATGALLAGEIARVDLGQANGRYFIFAAGVGFDASVTRGLDLKAKRRLGMLAYVTAATIEALKLRGEETTIVADGHASRQRMLMVVVNNTRLYAGVLRMAPKAFVDDGLLDVSVFRGRGLRVAARHTILALLGLHRTDADVDCFQTASVSIDSRNALPVQLDGDYFGTTPVTFRAAPGALRAIIPPGSHPEFQGLRTED